MKYRKRPVEIEAIQWTGGPQAWPDKWAAAVATWEVVPSSGAGSALIIDTLEGKLRAEPGDYIIQGVKGEFYPCKPDIFAATYEPVAE